MLIAVSLPQTWHLQYATRSTGGAPIDDLAAATRWQ
jgi:hypothetical protein